MPEKNAVPHILDLLVFIDEDLRYEIRRSPVLRDLFRFFDSPNKPLNPREFLEFVSSLSEDDQLYYFFVL